MWMRRCFVLVQFGLGFVAMCEILYQRGRSLDLVVLLLDGERMVMHRFDDVDWHFLMMMCIGKHLQKRGGMN